VSSITSQASTPASEAATLQALTIQAIDTLDADITSNKTTLADGILSSIQIYNRQALSIFPLLSSGQKTSLASMCAQQASLLEPDLHVLPESVQMDGMLVMAGFNAIQDAAK
jgi:hypothetical protein